MCKLLIKQSKMRVNLDLEAGSSTMAPRPPSQSRRPLIKSRPNQSQLRDASNSSNLTKEKQRIQMVQSQLMTAQIKNKRVFLQRIHPPYRPKPPVPLLNTENFSPLPSKKSPAPRRHPKTPKLPLPGSTRPPQLSPLTSPAAPAVPTGAPKHAWAVQISRAIGSAICQGRKDRVW